MQCQTVFREAVCHSLFSSRECIRFRFVIRRITKGWVITLIIPDITITPKIKYLFRVWQGWTSNAGCYDSVKIYWPLYNQQTTLPAPLKKGKREFRLERGLDECKQSGWFSPFYVKRLWLLWASKEKRGKEDRKWPGRCWLQLKLKGFKQTVLGGGGRVVISECGISRQSYE